MQNWCLNVPLLWLALTSALGTAAAAPLIRADVPADPAWVFHLDCDALRQTYLGKYLIYQMDKPELNSNMITFQNIFTFDLRTQFHGMTVFGGDDFDQGLFIIYADFVPAHLIELLGKSDQPEHFTTNHHTIYGWLDKQTDPHTGRRVHKYAAVEKNRMIIGISKASVLRELAVLEGQSPNLASTKTWLELGPTKPGLFIQGEARKMNFLGNNPTTALLKIARNTRLTASETNDHLTAILTVDTSDENAARQLAIVAQGSLALLSVQQNPAMARIVHGLSVNQTGAVVTITLSVPSIDLISAIKTNLAQQSH